MRLLIGGYLLGLGVTTILAGAAVEKVDDPQLGRAAVLVAVWPLTVLLIAGMIWWSNRQ